MKANFGPTLLLLVVGMVFTLIMMVIIYNSTIATTGNEMLASIAAIIPWAIAALVTLLFPPGGSGEAYFRLRFPIVYYYKS